WRPVFGDEWPARRTFPSEIAADGESRTFDGVTFTVHDLGPGESHSDSIWVMTGGRSGAFIGDVVMHGVHAYVADGHTGAWLDSIERARGLVASAGPLYPGHGDPGGAELLDWENRYLSRYRREVALLAGGRTSLTDEEKAALTARMKEELPTDRLEFLIGLG